MFRAVVEEAAVLASLSLFIGMIADLGAGLGILAAFSISRMVLSLLGRRGLRKRVLG